MKTLRLLLWAASIAGASIVAFAPGLEGTPEIAQKERRTCLTCHTAVGRADLNDAGKYYKEHKTFEDYPGELPPRTETPEQPSRRPPDSR